MNEGPSGGDMRIPRRLRFFLALSVLCSLGALTFSRLLGFPALLLILPALRDARLPRGRPLWKFTLGGLGLALLVFAAAITVVFSWQPYWIPTSSMEPALQVGDRIIVDEGYYRLRSPRVGDIVTYKPPDIVYDPQKPIFVKRIVGLPGDEVSLIEGRLYRNGERVETEPIASLVYTGQLQGASESLAPFTTAVVPEATVYVFGDNGALSLDSRYWGGVPLENLRGKVIYRFWPMSRIGKVH